MEQNRFKFKFDIGIAIIFALLFSPAVTSLAFHEIASIVLGVALIIHVLLNKSWIIGMGKKIFSKSIKRKTRLSYILNTILLIDMFIIMISGLLISEVVLPNFRYDSNINWLPLHMASSIIGLLIVGIHIGLHWNWITQMASHIPKWKKLNSFRKPSLKLMSRILLVVGTIAVLPQVSKMVVLTPMIFSESTFGLEAREGNVQHIEESKDHDQKFPSNENELNRENGELEGQNDTFSIIKLVWIIPVLIIYSASLFSIAFYTHLFEKRSLNKRIRAS